MEVLHVDNHILVVNKPHGIPTQVSPSGGISLEEMAKEWVKKAYNKQGNVFLHPIHRLDKVAGGIVLFARTSKALSRLQCALREGQIKRVYEAEVEQEVKESKGHLIHYLLHSDHISKIACDNTKGAKKAELFFTKISSNRLRIQLVTGRYHQIRAQLSAIGHPIIGDWKYGAKKTENPNQISLYHVEISFIHPVTKESMVISL